MPARIHPLSLLAALSLPLAMGSCGRKEPAAVPAPAPPPTVTKAEEAPTPVATPSSPATTPAPVVTTSSPAPAVVGERSPADAAAWQLWDRAASRLRDIGFTVRESANPKRLELVVHNSIHISEVRTILNNAHRSLGGGAASVVLYDKDGVQVAGVNP